MSVEKRIWENFKQRYNLKNKKEVIAFLMKNGKIIGAKKNIEYWLLPDKTRVLFDIRKKKVINYYRESNEHILNLFRPEFFKQKIKR